MLAADAETHLHAGDALRKIGKIFAAHRRHRSLDVQSACVRAYSAQMLRPARVSLTTGGYPARCATSASHAIRRRQPHRRCDRRAPRVARESPDRAHATFRSSSTSSAMTLLRYPPAIVPIVTTTLLSGSVSRAAMFCSASTIAAAAGIASTAVCGYAPWPPFPRTVNRSSSAEALTGPGVMPIAPGFQSRVDVQHRDRFDLWIVEAPCFDHRQRRRPGLLRPVERCSTTVPQAIRASGGEHARRAEQHRGVRVVPARVHLPFDLGGERQTGAFGNRQRVHIRAQRDGMPRCLAANDADHAGRATRRCSMPRASSSRSTSAAVSCSSNPSSGRRWMVRRSSSTRATKDCFGSIGHTPTCKRRYPRSRPRIGSLDDDTCRFRLRYADQSHERLFIRPIRRPT